MSEVARRWAVVVGATALGLVDIALLVVWLRPRVRRAWASGGAGARITVSVLGLMQLLLLAFVALIITLAVVPFGGTCCL
jgi:hypothetical protein